MTRCPPSIPPTKAQRNALEAEALERELPVAERTARRREPDRAVADPPLKEALDCGICSIEADVVLVNGELLVAHKREEVTPGRTLQSLYLEPLRKRIATPHSGYDDALHALAQFIIDAEKAAGGPCSVGIGMPGAISPRSGRVFNAYNTPFNGRRLRHAPVPPPACRLGRRD